VIRLLMNDTNLEPKISRNSVAEIVGREKPENVVVISGHLDSWGKFFTHHACKKQYLV